MIRRRSVSLKRLNYFWEPRGCYVAYSPAVLCGTAISSGEYPLWVISGHRLTRSAHTKAERSKAALQTTYTGRGAQGVVYRPRLQACTGRVLRTYLKITARCRSAINAE
jgi:hypothetical protein